MDLATARVSCGSGERFWATNASEAFDRRVGDGRGRIISIISAKDVVTFGGWLLGRVRGSEFRIGPL